MRKYDEGQDDEGNGAAGKDTGSSTQQRKPEAAENGSTATAAKEPTGASRSDGDALFDDDAAETRQRAEQTAEELLEALSKAKDLPALKAAYDGNQLELAGLPEDLADAVEGGYDRNLKRLGSTRIKIARQVAEAQAEPAK